MTSLHPTCPISTRPAYFGARRIAPVAATARTEAWGARPAVEELRPARRHARSIRTRTQAGPSLFAATYVTHVLGQFAASETIDPQSAARSYAAAEALGGDCTQRITASI